MKFQRWERVPKFRLEPRRQGVLEPGMQAAIDLLQAEANRAEADAKAFSSGELADGAWLRHVAAKISANYLYARLVELQAAGQAEGARHNADQT